MVTHRGYRYRIYPTQEQEATLLRWEGVLRFLWNLGLEQWHLWMAGASPVRWRGERHLWLAEGATEADAGPLGDIDWCHSKHHDAARKGWCEQGDPEAPKTRAVASIYPSAMGQNRELTALRAEHDWIAEVSRNVQESLFFDLEAAWKRCFERGGTPHWKRRGDTVGMCESHGREFKVGADHVTFPKLGKVRAVIHRPLGGKQKAITITRDADQWYVSIMCEVELPDPVPSTKPAVGIDRGVVNLLADSNGGFVLADVDREAKMRAQIARAQRTVARRKKGSKNRRKALEKLASLHRKTRRQREHVLHVESHRLAKNHGLIVMEKLHVKNMTASAAGTEAEPGTNVRQKAGLNRSILASGWGKFATMLRYKVVPEGGEVREVPAAYSSQECHGCGHIDSANRPDQATFCCGRCGIVEHADTNAAKVILARGLQLTAVEPTVAACRGSATRRPKKQEARSARTKQPKHQARAA